ncbi:leucine-rich repeat domain-containing protein [Brachyspira pilosicoli]|uniref:leucine-rich repeat domain-containing protein n=1 Tax=Brachyspira pilosicoli TaxID=52584 RepID=UPI0030043423
MCKKIVLLVVLCFLVVMSCSSPSSPNSGNQDNNIDIGNNGDSGQTGGGSGSGGNDSGVITPTNPTEEELLIEKYGIDIGQDDAIISQKIKENLKAYYEEKGSYRVIFVGTPKTYYNSKSSLSFLVYEAAKSINCYDVTIDTSYINFKNGTIQSYMFARGLDLEETVTLKFIFPKNTIKIIESYAFSLLTPLKEITIPSSVEKIEEKAFQYCDALETIILEYGIKNIGASSFVISSALKTLKIPESVTSIEEKAFANCGLKELTIPASVTSMGKQVFISSIYLTDVTYMGTSPDIIDNTDALLYCRSLKTLRVPNAVNPSDERWKTFLGGNFSIVTR